MPHSLRAKLSGLHYKGILGDKDYKRLCKALDTEKVIDDTGQSFCIMPSKCKKCGKPLTLFEGWTCAECEKKQTIPKSVIDDIRAEIEHEMNRDIGGSATDFVSGRKCGMGEVLQIIDKHIKAVEE